MEPQFSFPFKPYAIQEQFMRELYFTIENKSNGIFESPTGTGKSLSICCGALQWLKDYNNKNLEQLEKEILVLKLETKNENVTEDWLSEEYEKIQKKQQLATLQTKLDTIKKAKEELTAMKIRVEKNKLNKNDTSDYQKGNLDRVKNKDVGDKENLEAETAVEDSDLILEEINEENEESDVEVNKEEEQHYITKLYISSRTHSQLSQFVGELKRTEFSELSVLTMGSRQHYCINPEVIRLNSVQLINERCLDLQKSKSKPTSVDKEGMVMKKCKTKSCGGCPYYNQSNITKLKERLLVDIMDMEDIVKNGKQLKACPYYATRIALEQAEVVLISHAGIVSAGARSAARVTLTNNILILDEAHGLTAALEQANSAPLSTKQLQAINTYIKFYLKKYMSRLNSKNLLSLNQMVFVVGRLLKMLQPQKEESSIYTIEDFVIKAEIDHLNLRPLIQFCRQTKLAPKLHGFSLRYDQSTLEEEQNKSTKKTSFQSFLNNISKNKPEVQEKVPENPVEVKTSSESPGSALYALLDVLSRLGERSQDGRVLRTEAGLKYLLLDPAEHFSQVVKQCRSVILAGGTMEPISEFEQLIFGAEKVDYNKLRVLRCDHVVPSDNVLALCLSQGPTNVKLNLTYENRMADQMLSEVARIIRGVSRVVPAGMVVFVPSYSMEAVLYDRLVGIKDKHLFREPKTAKLVDKVLNDYSSCIRNKTDGKNGALLLSVVGGKLSEGLNFSDELGRCVMVVGMPYPNSKSPELKEKMRHLSETVGPATAQRYYEGLCIKAVNQCVGRAIRHAADYACVLLVDGRYSRGSTAAALPSFLQKSLKTDCTFGTAVGSIAKFFAKHKKS